MSIDLDSPFSGHAAADRLVSRTRHRFLVVDGPFEVGDVSFHRGWTFHRAGPTTSDRPRSVMTIIYMDQHMRFDETLNAVQERDGADWCPGVRPGRVIDTPMNPVVFST